MTRFSITNPCKAASAISLALMSGLLLSACQPAKPKGQVVAVVNGQEITVQDLQAEARANPTQSQDPAAVTQRVVARALLAQEAHDRKFDQYPGLPADLARLKQQLVVQKLVQATVKPSGPVSDAEISAFIQQHPYMFSQRERLIVDGVQFRGSAKMTELQGIQNIDALISRLKSLNVTFSHQKQNLDTANLPPELVRHMLDAPSGNLILIGAGQGVFALQILNHDHVAVSDADAHALAQNLLTQRGAEKQLNDEVVRLRDHAKITYQPGYAPPKTAIAAAGSTPGASASSTAAPAPVEAPASSPPQAQASQIAPPGSPASPSNVVAPGSGPLFSPTRH